MSTVKQQVSILDGRSFVDAQTDKRNSSQFQGMYFLGNKYQTRSTKYVEKPEFGDTFEVCLPNMDDLYVEHMSDFATDPPKDFYTLGNQHHQSNSFGDSKSLTALLGISEPLHMCLFRTSSDKYVPSLIATCKCEWRLVLAQGSVDVEAELHSSSIPELVIGILRLRFTQLVEEAMDAPSIQLISRHITNDLWLSKVLTQQTYREYIQWEQWLQDAPSSINTRKGHAFFVTNEYNTKTPVTSYISRLEVQGNSICSPEQALEFVNSISHLRHDSQQTWLTPQNTLATLQATGASLATTLCSFLLGFGLNAYVAYGTSCIPLLHESTEASLLPTVKPHYWVITISKAGKCTHWDPVTGKVYNEHIQNVPYQQIHTIFRNDYFAHYVTDTPVTTVNFHLPQALSSTDHTVLEAAQAGNGWIALNCTTQSRIPSPQKYKLSKATLHSDECEQKIETQLQHLITSIRERKFHTSTTFSGPQSYTLKSALYDFAVLHRKSTNSNFEEAVQNTLPADHLFLAIPVKCHSLDAKQVLETILDASSSLQQFQIDSPSALFAVKAHVTVYPENLVTVWVMLAAAWKDVQTEETQ